MTASVALAAPPPPIRCPRCGSLVREDTQFTVEMRVYDSPQRRYVCGAGHSLYGVRVPTLHVPVGPAHRGRAIAKRCVWCHEPFEGPTQQQYCSKICGRAQDAARTRARGQADRTRLTGEALRVARAIEIRGRVGPPQAYASRSVSRRARGVA